jgi:hypothetical protein
MGDDDVEDGDDGDQQSAAKLRYFEERVFHVRATWVRAANNEIEFKAPFRRFQPPRWHGSRVIAIVRLSETHANADLPGAAAA